mmetsp:Transcript_17980/g.45973  ORF Transcript_17980/g.45973 Transcript_17980/m.45973 type:complete len:222 (-) Transcript_17980:209-874(-)
MISTSHLRAHSRYNFIYTTVTRSAGRSSETLPRLAARASRRVARRLSASALGQRQETTFHALGDSRNQATIAPTLWRTTWLTGCVVYAVWTLDLAIGTPGPAMASPSSTFAQQQHRPKPDNKGVFCLPFYSALVFSASATGTTSASVADLIASAPPSLEMPVVPSAMPSAKLSVTSLRLDADLPRSLASGASLSGPKKSSAITPITPISPHPSPKRPITGE